MTDCIIFSKDRACQLDLLLRSMRLYTDISKLNIKVIFNYSNDDFANGYQKLIEQWANVSWIFEGCNKIKDILLGSIKEDYVMFLVDDISFIDNFSFESDEFKMLQHKSDLLTLSLRLSPNINFCYAYNCSVSVPNFINGRAWDWRGERGDWGYPVSLDGNIFRASDIIEGIININFAGPNELEGELGNYIRGTTKKYLMTCFKQQKLVNFPLNKVQTILKNKSLDISVSSLNDNYLLGKRISFDTLKGIRNNMCHVEISNLIFEDYK